MVYLFRTFIMAGNVPQKQFLEGISYCNNILAKSSDPNLNIFKTCQAVAFSKIHIVSIFILVDH